jgi:tRNA pseudouridine38-40 synthase
MRRIQLTLTFDGTQFAGLQLQRPGLRTIQGVLEDTLRQFPGAIPQIAAAGRTDAGVHALAMPVHYDTEDTIPTERLPLALNQKLPPDLRVIAAQEQPLSFHARHSCRWRHYRYRIWHGTSPTALEHRRVLWLPYRLNPQLIAESLPALLGEHDFATFSVREERQTTHHMWVSRLENLGHELVLEWIGTGFARGQIRSMVGTLIQVGRGRRSPSNFADLLTQKDRNLAGPTAAPHGLYFAAAGYEPFSLT